MEKALPAEPAMAGPCNRLPECFASADAGTVIGMSKENGRCDLQEFSFEVDAPEILTINHVRPPSADCVQRALHTQISHAPGRCPRRHVDAFSRGGQINFMT